MITLDKDTNEIKFKPVLPIGTELYFLLNNKITTVHITRYYITIDKNDETLFNKIIHKITGKVFEEYSFDIRYDISDFSFDVRYEPEKGTFFGMYYDNEFTLYTTKEEVIESIK